VTEFRHDEDAKDGPVSPSETDRTRISLVSFLWADATLLVGSAHISLLGTINNNINSPSRLGYDKHTHAFTPRDDLEQSQNAR
jgi:hypothetical protein